MAKTSNKMANMAKIDGSATNMANDEANIANVDAAMEKITDNEANMGSVDAATADMGNAGNMKVNKANEEANESVGTKTIPKKAEKVGTKTKMANVDALADNRANNDANMANAGVEIANAGAMMANMANNEARVLAAINAVIPPDDNNSNARLFAAALGAIPPDADAIPSDARCKNVRDLTIRLLKIPASDRRSGLDDAVDDDPVRSLDDPVDDDPVGSQNQKRTTKLREDSNVNVDNYEKK